MHWTWFEGIYCCLSIYYWLATCTPPRNDFATSSLEGMIIQVSTLQLDGIDPNAVDTASRGQNLDYVSSQIQCASDRSWIQIRIRLMTN